MEEGRVGEGMWKGKGEGEDHNETCKRIQLVPIFPEMSRGRNFFTTCQAHAKYPELIFETIHWGSTSYEKESNSCYLNEIFNDTNSGEHQQLLSVEES